MVLCSLDSDVERPELREFKSKPVEIVLADRGRYVAAALIVVRAYLAAGCPNELPPLASFGDWSRLVRSPLVWLGRADPVETMETARAEDPELDDLRRVIVAWVDAVGLDRPHTAGELKQVAEKKSDWNAPLAHPLLNDALLQVAGGRGEIDAQKLGRWLGRKRGRIVDGCKITAQDDRKSKQLLWSLRRSDGLANAA